MKLRILSDLHTEGCKHDYVRLDEDVLVLAGDIGVGKRAIDFIKSLPKDLPIVYVAGNHEYYRHDFPMVNKEMEEAFKDTNVHFLRNAQCIIGGVRFLGSTMFSDFGMYGENDKPFAKQASARGITDFHIISNGLNEHYETKRWTTDDHVAEFEKFERFMKFALKLPFDGKTVVVTHFCPSEKSVHPRFGYSAINPYFTSNCEHFMGFSDLWIHGHTHDSYDYEVSGTRVIANPKGYGLENKNGFNPNLVVEI